jgi:hypothetical protein
MTDIAASIAKLKAAMAAPKTAAVEPPEMTPKEAFDEAVQTHAKAVKPEGMSQELWDKLPEPAKVSLEVAGGHAVKPEGMSQGLWDGLPEPAKASLGVAAGGQAAPINPPEVTQGLVASAALDKVPDKAPEEAPSEAPEEAPEPKPRGRKPKPPALTADDLSPFLGELQGLREGVLYMQEAQVRDAGLLRDSLETASKQIATAITDAALEVAKLMLSLK